MDNNNVQIKHFTNQVTAHLSQIVSEVLFLNTYDTQFLLLIGAVYVNNERQTKDKIITARSSLRVHTKPRRYNCNFFWRDLIIFENDFFLVLNKPAGVPSHPTIDNSIENALTQTSLARNYPLYVTHRLDTLTSGLIVYAKKSSFAKSFNLQLQARSVQKKYVALVESTKVFPAKLIHYMSPASGTPKILSDTLLDGWQNCELEVVAQKAVSPKISWVKINLLTGRTHQIRSQFSFCHAPILGDSLYGSDSVYRLGGIALRSCELEFICNEQRMKFNIDEQFDSI